MEIRNLQGADMAEFTNCFNTAFSDYIVTFNATKDYLVNRWVGARIDYTLSYGVWDGPKMVAFIVNGIDQRRGALTAHNNGTGVIPDYRGQRLVDRIYDRAIPELKARGVTRCTLEVICGNDRAIRVYERNGFTIGRQLHCYAGLPTEEAGHFLQLELREMVAPDWPLYATLGGVEPAWEQNNRAVLALQDQYTYLHLHQRGEVVGYAIINEATGSLPQLAIAEAHRGQGYGRYLFSALAKRVPKIKVNNVDAAAVSTNVFLEKSGVGLVLSQYEMERGI
ncbi:MAG: GNAT family N-acetyltransferase [Bacteroidota bacterium]